MSVKDYSNHIADIAFVTAAGKGTRLRPYTDTMPKPMVRVHDKPIIDYVLEDLGQFGVQSIGVNTWYKAEVIETHLSERHTPNIQIIREDDLLDTGGGIKNGLQAMGVIDKSGDAQPAYKDKAIFITSAKAIWTNKQIQALQRMANMWDPDNMDMLLLLQPLENIRISEPIGDYTFNANGEIKRSKDRTGTHMWTSVRLLKASLFSNTPKIGDPFSFLDVMDTAERNDRLYGLEHDADWYHIRTPDDLDAVNALSADQLPGQNIVTKQKAV